MTVYVKTANKGKLNLRAKPNGTLIAQIPYGTQLEAAETEGAWTKVTYNDKTGYVKTEFLAVANNTLTKDDLQKVYNSLQQALKTIETILK